MVFLPADKIRFMKMGIRAVVEAVISALIGLAISSFAQWPWYFFIALAAIIFLAYNFVLVPLWKRFTRKVNTMNNELDPMDTTEVDAKLAASFPNGVGIGIIGGSNNHIIDPTVQGWANGVGIGVVDSPDTTITNANVSDGTNRNPNQ